LIQALDIFNGLLKSKLTPPSNIIHQLDEFFLDLFGHHPNKIDFKFKAYWSLLQSNTKVFLSFFFFFFSMTAHLPIHDGSSGAHTHLGLA
jgi:hypothetical protein